MRHTIILLLAVLNHEKIESAILVGHSMGFAAILEAAIQAPDRIIGLVPVDVMQNVEQKFSKTDIDYEVGKRQPYIEKRIEENFANHKYKNAWIESLREYFKWRSDKLCDVLTALDMPVININSDRKITNIDMVRKYKPDFDVRIVSGVGHGVMIEAPQEFNRLLRDILADFISRNKRDFSR